MLLNMRPLHKKVTAAVIAAALVVPMSAGPAAAQSSFISGSSSSSDASTNHGSKAKQLERAVEELLIANGQIKSPAAEAHAQKLLQRALNYEIPFVDDAYETLDFSSRTQSFVARFPVSEIDNVLQNTDGIEDFDAGFGSVSVPFGVAVGKDSDYFYVTMSFIAG